MKSNVQVKWEGVNQPLKEFMPEWFMQLSAVTDSILNYLHE